jgi:hypothetical protein
MKRIATQLVSLTSLGLLTFGFASACASEQSAFPGSGNNADSSVGVGGGGGAGGGGAAGAPADPSCASNPPSATFCPGSANGMGVACCLSLGTCGIDLGMGCITPPTMPTPYGG